MVGRITVLRTRTGRFREVSFREAALEHRAWDLLQFMYWGKLVGLQVYSLRLGFKGLGCKARLVEPNIEVDICVVLPKPF